MSNNWRKKKMLSLMLFILLILATSFHVFLKSFIEWGEERFWLFPYLLIVPLIASVLIFFYLSKNSYLIRLSFTSVALLCLVFGFYKIAVLADAVNEGRVANKLYPVAVRLEAVYLKIFNYEEQFFKYHEDKLYYVSVVETLNSCDQQAITNLISTDGARKLKSRSIDFIDNYLINYFKSNCCPAEVMNLVKNNQNRLY